MEEKAEEKAPKKKLTRGTLVQFFDASSQRICSRVITHALEKEAPHSAQKQAKKKQNI
jgi:hypothetical protein